MFRILILQASHSLSDERTEYLVKDRLSFMRFLGLGLADRVPDATSIWNFREALTRAQIGGVPRSTRCCGASRRSSAPRAASPCAGRSRACFAVRQVRVTASVGFGQVGVPPLLPAHPKVVGLSLFDGTVWASRAWMSSVSATLSAPAPRSKTDAAEGDRSPLGAREPPEDRRQRRAPSRRHDWKMTARLSPRAFRAGGSGRGRRHRR